MRLISQGKRANVPYEKVTLYIMDNIAINPKTKEQKRVYSIVANGIQLAFYTTKKQADKVFEDIISTAIANEQECYYFELDNEIKDVSCWMSLSEYMEITGEDNEENKGRYM